MSRTLSPPEIGWLAATACILEAGVAKPGNVSPAHPFEDTTFKDFVLSAVAAGPALAVAGDVGVGKSILNAVSNSRHHVRSNTNLGIVLLLGPLCAAASRPGGDLRTRLASVLGSLSLEDARYVYQAIRQTAPGGLGGAPAEDVTLEPTLALRQAMALAAERDSIAREYVTDYDVTFRLAAPVLTRTRESGLDWPAAVLEAYLQVLSEVPDTLIARKEGEPAALAVRDRAREVLASGGAGSVQRSDGVRALDRELRGRGNRLNPGTTADLVVAALFVRLLAEY